MCECHLILSGPSRVVLRIEPIFIILIIFPSLNKFILGSQVKVPQFTGCLVLWTVRLDGHNIQIHVGTQPEQYIDRISAHSFMQYYLVICFCIVE